MGENKSKVIGVLATIGKRYWVSLAWF